MKNFKIKNEIISENPIEISSLLEKKYTFFQDIIKKTTIHVQKCKFMDIVGISDVHKCINLLKTTYEHLNDLYVNRETYSSGAIMQTLQSINVELSSILRSYGTESFEDLIIVCVGNGPILNNCDDKKYKLLKKHFHPTGYSVISYKNPTNQLLCEDIIGSHSKFHVRVYGANIILYDEVNKKCLQITGLIDDVILDFISEEYITDVKKQIHDNVPNTIDFRSEAFVKFQSSLTLKDFILHSNKDLFSKFMGYANEIKIMNQKGMAGIVKKFIDEDTYSKRLMLIIFLIYSHVYENQYMAYLLYDTLTNDNETLVDTQEQTIIFDSFPWSIKELFREAMKTTAEYTTNLSSFDVNKIPLEQQICLMKVEDHVKEKAMAKLKEIKTKSEDSAGKPRQYLDGLLKIPFGIYRKEDILKIMDNIKDEFSQINEKEMPFGILNKENITSADVINHMNLYYKEIKNYNKHQLLEITKEVNKYIKTNQLNPELKIKYVGMQKSEMTKKVVSFIETNPSFHLPVYKSLHIQFDKIKNYMTDVKEVLDNSVYGHEKAKQQIFRIIGQWINGEQSGYCFGFEGPPGTGKTSLAKNGLSYCLKDKDGTPRPFSMIQIGGDCQGSTLAGHNYTYVGSSWGSIVQILMDKKCMNPIIFIDEIDKVSKTEHGKELIGIMTHMLDPTQNDCFQDKYFSGVDIDLSKVLFILSYNDASLIDKILLDRVHRVKFSSLSLDEKIVITNKYILPEVYKKMGLIGVVKISDEIIQFLIEQYTFEPGVRKLKELFFDVIGELNLEILSGKRIGDLPFVITKDEIIRYTKEKHDVKYRQIYTENKVGTINGMYATSMGTGGILPISANFFPSNDFFSLKLTGLQQEVMKESMHLAFTIAWNLTSLEVQVDNRKKYEKENCCGINIHAGDLDVQKEGPSASIAICCAIYSLINNKPIKQTFAVTGELSMQGEAMAIGGLDHKILGSIKSGVKSFIYPHENQRQFNEFFEKYKDKKELEGIQFHEVKNIDEVIHLIF